MTEQEFHTTIAIRDAEIARLNKWADGFTDIHLKERATGELYQRELRGMVSECEAQIELLRAALKRLSFAAQTTGGTAGRDDELCKAIEDAEFALKTSEKIAVIQDSAAGTT